MLRRLDAVVTSLVFKDEQDTKPHKTRAPTYWSNELERYSRRPRIIYMPIYIISLSL